MDPKQVDPTLSLPWAIICRATIPAVFYFPLAPQRAQFTFPFRVATHQTMTGNYVDDFSGDGSVMAHADIRGTFGFNAKAGGAIGFATPGSVTLKQLEVILETFAALDRQTKKDRNAVQEFICLPRQYFWRVVIKDFTVSGSVQDPLLWNYRLSLERLEDYLSPVGLANKIGGAISGVGDALGSLAA